MKSIRILGLLGLVLVGSIYAYSPPSKVQQAKESLKAFPEAEAGYVRYVFRLPALDDESLHKVSLVVGKQVETDSVNQYGISGTIETVSIPGWGYSYYKVESNGEIFGTLMAAPESAPKIQRFIEIRSDLGLLRYNSKLPVVVIAPEGFEVNYRVWSAGELLSAEEE